MPGKVLRTHKAATVNGIAVKVLRRVHDEILAKGVRRVSG